LTEQVGFLFLIMKADSVFHKAIKQQCITLYRYQLKLTAHVLGVV